MTTSTMIEADSTERQAKRPIGIYTGTDGEFAGWQNYEDQGFETHAGPFWFREEPDGTMRCAFRAQDKQCRDVGIIHGGCLMTFADISLYMIGRSALQGDDGVTVSLNCDFLDAARAGDLVIGSGEVTRAGGSLIFVRGQLTEGERRLLTFSGTLRRLKRKGPPPDVK